MAMKTVFGITQTKISFKKQKGGSVTIKSLATSARVEVTKNLFVVFSRVILMNFLYGKFDAALFECSKFTLLLENEEDRSLSL